MSGKTILVLLTLTTLVLADAQLRAEDRAAKRTFHECFLYRGSEGAVWVGQPLVSLGMIGVMAFPPQYRLCPQLAERFAPLVNDLRIESDERIYRILLAEFSSRRGTPASRSSRHWSASPITMPCSHSSSKKGIAGKPWRAG